MTRWRLTALAALLVAGCVSAPPQVGSGAPDDAPSLAPTPDTRPTPRASPREIGTVAFTADGSCSLDLAAEEVRPGPFTLLARSAPDGVVRFHMWRILDTHTYADLEAAMQVEIRLTLEGKPFAGPPSWIGDLVDSGALEPGQDGTMRGTLREATYGIVCQREFRHLPPGEYRVAALVGPIEVP